MTRSGVAMAYSCVGVKILQKKMWEGPYWEGVWPCLHPWDSVRLPTASTYWNVPGKYGPGGFERSAVKPLRLCGNAQGVCVGWSTPFWQQKVKPDLVAVSVLIQETGGGKAVLKARNGSALARQARSPLAVSCMSTTMSAEIRDAFWDSSESLGSPCCVRSVRKVCGRVRGMGAWKICHSK